MQAEITYNWDDLEVGRFDLNNSENFFTQKHLKHEKFPEELQLLRAMASANLNESFSNDISNKKKANKENASPVTHRETQTIDAPFLSAKDQAKSETENHKIPENEPSTSVLNSNKHRVKSTQSKSKGTGTTAKSGKKRTKAEPPQVYNFKDIYQKKKDEKMKKVMDEEKKNRVFHSRPVPKSVNTPREVPKELPSSKLTVVKTPLVLKNSQEALEKRKQRLEEWKNNNAPVKFSSREAVVLQEQPFKPKKSGHTVHVQPFNLHVERRLEERKQYDEQYKRSSEEKRKQEEEERHKREEELVKELRKLASFKARPNPFK